MPNLPSRTWSTLVQGAAYPGVRRRRPPGAPEWGGLRLVEGAAALLVRRADAAHDLLGRRGDPATAQLGVDHSQDRVVEARPRGARVFRVGVTVADLRVIGQEQVAATGELCGRSHLVLGRVVDPA